jgi:hypothetical protein
VTRTPAVVTLAALSAVGALVLTSCSSASDVRDATPVLTSTVTSVTAPTTPTTTPPEPATPSASESASAAPAPPPPVAAAPRVGNCYATSGAASRHQVDGSSPIPCGRRHTAETFAVVKSDGSPSRADIDTVWRVCAQRFKRYVGDSPTISTIGYTVIRPSAAQLAAGQAWVRCDAIELANYNQPHGVGKVGLVRVGSLARALTGGVPGRFRGCARHWPKVDQAVHFTSCQQHHQAELIPESLNLGAPNAPYPGKQSSVSSSENFCRKVFQDYVPETDHFYYYYPTSASWKSGTHDTTCWALDTVGDGIPPI